MLGPQLLLTSCLASKHSPQGRGSAQSNIRVGEYSLYQPEAFTSARKTSPPEVPNPEIKKLLTLLTPLWALQGPLARAKIPSCWGRTASILPRMEPGLQAGHMIVPSAILRPRRVHKASSPSETHM